MKQKQKSTHYTIESSHSRTNWLAGHWDREVLMTHHGSASNWRKRLNEELLCSLTSMLRSIFKPTLVVYLVDVLVQFSFEIGFCHLFGLDILQHICNTKTSSHAAHPTSEPSQLTITRIHTHLEPPVQVGYHRNLCPCPDWTASRRTQYHQKQSPVMEQNQSNKRS